MVLRWYETSTTSISRPPVSGREEAQEATTGMFGSIGGPELLVIFVIALLIFGPRKLSELGRTLGKGVAEFRKAASDLRDTLDAEVSRAEPPSAKNNALTSPREERDQNATSDAETRDRPS
jgi:TatA/E family protein of Tat protein translocase